MRLTTVLLLMLSAATIAQTDELTVKSGRWETKVITTNTVMPDPVTTTTTVCIENAIYDPKTLLDDVESCQTNSSTVSGDTLRFSMQCKMQGANADIAGNFTARDDEGEGEMAIEMQAGPIQIDIQLSWTTQHVGDECE